MMLIERLESRKGWGTSGVEGTIKRQREKTELIKVIIGILGVYKQIKQYE